MLIKKAQFIMSNEDYKKCPTHELPEYAFIGRSNVGKSSLINMLTNKKKLAKTSGTPGKTLFINHFFINQEWYLVDLPGYGFVRQSKKMREKLKQLIYDYILHRTQLTQLFILLDSRHELKQVDEAFINFVGQHNIPMALVMTKTDKLKSEELSRQRQCYEEKLSIHWEVLPPIFETSSVNQKGKSDLLSHIEHVNSQIQKDFK